MRNVLDSQDYEWWMAAEAFARGNLGSGYLGVETHAAPYFPDVLKKLSSLGFHELCLSEGLGGLGQNERALAAVLEPICRIDASIGAALFAQAACHLLLKNITISDEWAQRLLSLWLAWPAFHAIDEYVWPTMDELGHVWGIAPMLLPGAYASGAIIPVMHDSQHCWAVVGLQDAECGLSKPVRTLGLSAAGIVDVDWNGAVACHWFRMGNPDKNELYGRLAVPMMAMFCGLMKTSLDVAEVYCRERHQGGGILLGWGEVQRLLALMQQRYRVASQLLRYHYQSKEGDGEAIQAALHVGHLAQQLCDDGIQLLGGNGYMRDYGQEKRYRDVLSLRSLGGSVAWRRQCSLRPVECP